ncbi:MAG TPA: DUF177 domain-containing protein [Levilinea sp.]|nr:DUF177 domain-containing protein [Levilinea sp.]
MAAGDCFLVGSDRDLAQLAEAIAEFIRCGNRTAKSIRWSYTVEKLERKLGMIELKPVLSIISEHSFLPVEALNQPRYPLRLKVGFLLHQPIGASRDIHYDYPTLLLSELELTAFQGVLHLSRTPQGLLAQGDFLAHLSLECVRCLTSFDQTLHTTFSELFAFDARSADETGLVIPEDGNIDLEPIVYEYLLLELPMSAICREDCKGLCAYCGTNLNEISPTLHMHEEAER